MYPATLFALYLAVNVVFATLFWLVPGSVANACRPKTPACPGRGRGPGADTPPEKTPHPTLCKLRVSAAQRISAPVVFTSYKKGNSPDRLGSYEFQKRGISRFDLRDPYRIAVALTWPQFLAALRTAV
jgi:hypothetical protein